MGLLLAGFYVFNTKTNRLRPSFKSSCSYDVCFVNKMVPTIILTSPVCVWEVHVLRLFLLYRCRTVWCDHKATPPGIFVLSRSLCFQPSSCCVSLAAREPLMAAITLWTFARTSLSQVRMRRTQRVISVVRRAVSVKTKFHRLCRNLNIHLSDRRTWGSVHGFVLQYHQHWVLLI